MRYLYPFALLLLISTSLSAKHIIGGVLTYECLGGGHYRFTMKMYRDCSDPTGANFDFNAPFTIYKGDPGNTTLVTTIDVSPQTITDIEPEENPCLELPPNVCVEEGIYVFEYIFADWPSDETYHITYQRCCRNNTITNIQTPGDVGATFTVALSPASQGLCNNSPTFNDFPPIVICVNEPLSYDHSAFDLEGDQLVYELCAPFTGGGQGGGGGGGGGNCNSVTPNPACPPPYNTVTFINPPYSPLNPMGGSPQVTIDPISGMLTGTPNITGQFVVGICIKEYRNGVLLTTIRRDFQFNVANCTPAIVAEVNNPNGTAVDNDFFIKTCHELTIPFTNGSTAQGTIDELRWIFFTPDSTYVFDTWDVDMTFPESGSYTGKLLLNPNSLCGDSVNIFVDIFPEVVASFSYDYDTCVAGPVNFLNESAILGPGNFASMNWNLGDGAVDSVQLNPVHVYEEPKVVTVRLEVVDEHGCVDDTLRAVVYKPVPALILVKPNDTLSCPPATVLFNNLSTPIDNTYGILWEFGDGETGTDVSPTHIYNKEGVYDVRLEITSPIGCSTDTTFKGLVSILSPPIADFVYDPTDPTNFRPAVNFEDLSLRAVHWDWYVNGDLVSQTQSPTFSFPDTGLQEVTLIITHPEKCQDTLTQYIDVQPKFTFHLPNAFSPNEDTVNDYFKGIGVTRGITEFRMEIWDRWGARIFATTDPEEAWNGKIENTGKDAPQGVYICQVSFIGPRGERFQEKGFATLIK